MRFRFTLIEIVCAVTVMLLLGTVAAAVIRFSSPALELKRSAAEVERLFTLAGQLSAMRNRDVKLVFEKGMFKIVEPAPPDGSGNREYLSSRSYCFELPGEVVVEPEELQFNFRPDGSVSGPKFALTADESTLNFKASPLTGRLLESEQ